MRESEGPVQLYRHFDEDGGLLYVGISLSAVQRLSQHKSRSPWHQSIAQVDVENYPSWGEARAAEIAAITTERPRYNVLYNVPPETGTTQPAADSHLERLLCQYEETIRELRADKDDLRKRLDQATALLADLRPTGVTATPVERRSWWRRLFG